MGEVLSNPARFGVARAAAVIYTDSIASGALRSRKRLYRLAAASHIIMSLFIIQMMMKKPFALALAILLLPALCACGGKKPPETDVPAQNSTSSAPVCDPAQSTHPAADDGLEWPDAGYIPETAKYSGGGDIVDMSNYS